MCALQFSFTLVGSPLPEISSSIQAAPVLLCVVRHPIEFCVISWLIDAYVDMLLVTSGLCVVLDNFSLLICRTFVHIFGSSTFSLSQPLRNLSVIDTQ